MDYVGLYWGGGWQVVAQSSIPVTGTDSQGNFQRGALSRNVESRRFMFMSEKEKREELILRQRAELAIKKGTAELPAEVEREIEQEVLSALEADLSKLLVEGLEGLGEFDGMQEFEGLHVSRAYSSHLTRGSATASGIPVSGAGSNSNNSQKSSSKQQQAPPPPPGGGGSSHSARQAAPLAAPRKGGSSGSGAAGGKGVGNTGGGRRQSFHGPSQTLPGVAGQSPSAGAGGGGGGGGTSISVHHIDDLFDLEESSDPLAQQGPGAALRSRTRPAAAAALPATAAATAVRGRQVG